MRIKAMDYVRQNPRKAVAAVAVLLLVIVVLSRGSGKKMNFETASVEHLATFTDQAHCIVRPRALGETYLSVQRGGRLEDVSLKPGSPVKAGQIIAIVDRTANFAALKSALSGYRLAASDYQRSANLLQGGSATREEAESNRSKLDVKRAELEQAKQRVEDGIVRSPLDGIVSVVVFKLGDKVPDGGRVAAVEDPNGTQASCRLPVEVATQLTNQQTITWTLVDGKTPTSWTVPSRIFVEDPQGGFTGLDREVRVETNETIVRSSIGMLTDIALKLPPHENVAKLPSLAVVRREDGAYVLQKEKEGDFRWQKINIVKQNAQEVVAEGVPADGQILLLKDELGKIETYVKPRLAKSDAKKPATVN